MNKATFERFDELNIELMDGGLALTQVNPVTGAEETIFIPGRYVDLVLEQMELVARGAE